MDESHGSLPADPRGSAAQVEQIALLSLALVSGLVGLVVHAVWFLSIVLMAVLLGMTAAGLRRRPERGVVSEVVTEAKVVAADISSAVSAVDSPAPAPTAERE